MKKIAIMTAWLILCILITACGSKQETAVKEQLENFGEMVSILKEDNSKTTNEVNQVENEYDKETLVQQEESSLEETGIVGKWIPVGHEDTEDPVIINEDGTCMIRGEELTWVVDTEDTNEYELNIIVTNNEEPIYFVALDTSMEIGTVLRLSSQNYSGLYMRESSYEMVEITEDNLYDYFDIVEWTIAEDEYFYLYQDVLLKEEYQDNIIADISIVSAEFSYVPKVVQCSYDLESEKYALSEVSGTEDSETVNSEFYDYYCMNDKNRYGFHIGEDFIEGTEGEIHYCDEIELVHVEGVIYFLNK